MSRWRQQRGADGLGALVGSLGGNSDPAKLLQVMNQASEVSEEGIEEVGGVETTKYHVVLPREAFAETLGDNPQITQMLPKTVEFDMWVDGDDLVRVRREGWRALVVGRSVVSHGGDASVASPVIDC